MKVGVGLPSGGSDVGVGELVRLAVGVEQLGLDSVWVVDRWLRPHARPWRNGSPASRARDSCPSSLRAPGRNRCGRPQP
jgi:alkanesulfonate monooxygenase SsuD/methylene tetrahydromethanopterin reductase-like flavin-dependent oxidoreductase (luciferase family)